MVIKGILSEKNWPVEGIVDTGIVVIAHFDNPAKDTALDFILDVLRLERKCLIPTSTFIGAYHIMTEYIGVDRVSAHRALSRSLRVKSPALHQDVTVEATEDSLAYASGYGIESWDGYLVSLAKAHGASAIYSIDREMSRKVKDLTVSNPIPEEIFEKYNNWLGERLREVQRAS
jgi:predicted nucleic acid-binding protein